MPLFYVYKKEWCQYSESKGVLVKAKDWKRAKGIVMAHPYYSDQNKDNISVEEVEDIEEGIVCDTDYIRNDTSCN